ncbi:MAG: hypothetical protein FWB84_03330, partial [Candidatus Bathyarchaeota archaeon]|nr:hypothetical protein [Candidatus Termiticorpusculum sp.]
SWAWRRVVWSLMSYSFLFLLEYYWCERSESGFSADKWLVGGRFGKSVMTVCILHKCKGIWLNIIWL